jgi:hypothetical protein
MEGGADAVLDEGAGQAAGDRVGGQRFSEEARAMHLPLSSLMVG